MGWYFRRGSQAFGPVGAEELRILVRRGSVDKRTLVQREGSSEWQPAESALPGFFDTPPPAEGPATPIRYEEVFPEGAGDGAEEVNFSSGGFGDLDAFVDEMGENVDLSFSSGGDEKGEQQGGTSSYSTPAHATPTRDATPTQRGTPSPQGPRTPVREEDSKAVCFGCGRLLRKVELAQVEGASLCAECQQRLAQRAAKPSAPAPEPGFVETHLTEWICEAGVTLIALALFLGFLKGQGGWMLAAAPLALAIGALAACLCGGLEHSFGRRMIGVLVLLWLGALAVCLPPSILTLVVLLAGRAGFIWALGYHDIKKKAVLNALGVFLVVSVLGGVLVLRGAPLPWLIMILVLFAVTIAGSVMAWGAWQGGAGLALAGFGTLLYVWDALAAYSLLNPGNLWVSAAQTVVLTGLAALAVITIDRETGRPEGGGRWPLRREPLPLGVTDAVIALLAVVGVAVFAVFVLRRDHIEALVYGHTVLLVVLLMLGTNSRLTHPRHVKWLLLAWGLVLLATRGISVGNGPLHTYTLIELSTTYPVLATWQLVHLLGAVAVVFLARFCVERILAESVVQWQKFLMIFLGVLGVFGLREALAVPIAAGYPDVLHHGAYTASFGLIFAVAGVLLGLGIVAFQERK